MGKGKRVLNVFGIIFAIILSVVFVLGLVVAPTVLSTLSVTTPKEITNALTADADALANMVLSEADSEDEATAAFLSTDAFKEFAELYLTDVINGLSGKNETKLTAEALRKIIEDNIDDFVAIALESGEEGEMTAEEAKKVILDNLAKGGAEELLAEIPNPKELTDEMASENPEILTVFSALGKSNTIKIVIVVSLIAISALIFVCRLFNFKGVKWLFIDLYIASGILIPVCIGLFIGSGIVAQMAIEEPAIGTIVSGILFSLTTGVIIRSVVILFFAIALMVAHIIIQKAIAKKATACVDENNDAIVIEENPVQETI